MVAPSIMAGTVTLIPVSLPRKYTWVAPSGPWRSLVPPRRRLAARIVDGFVLMLGFMPFEISADFLDRAGYGVLAGVLKGAGLAWLLLYDPISVAWCGGGFGKRRLGMRVVRRFDGLRYPHFGMALWRSVFPLLLLLALVVPFVTFAALLVLLLDPLWLLWDRSVHCLHDKVAGTVVVAYRRPGGR